MANTVLFFFSKSVFVLFDNVVHIIINRCTAYNSRLASAVHNLPVNIKARLFILNKCACFFKIFKVFLSLSVNLVAVNISTFWQINLRLVNMQKRIRVVLNHLFCLITVHNIIRKSRDKRLLRLFGSECLKCTV